MPTEEDVKCRRCCRWPCECTFEPLTDLVQPGDGYSALRARLREVEGERDAFRAAIKRRCQCVFDGGKLTEECHYHACARHVRAENGDPSNMTLLEEVARLQAERDRLAVEVASLHRQVAFLRGGPAPEACAMIVHYAPCGPNVLGKFRCGESGGGYTAQPALVTCAACRRVSPRLWPNG